MDDAKPPTVWILLDSRRPGGIETHVGQLASGLVQACRPVEVVFFADHGPHPLRDQLVNVGIPTRSLAGDPGSLWQALRQGRPGLLHTHGYKAGILGRLLGRLAGIPVVSTFHAGEPGAGRVRLYATLDRWTSGLCTPIAVSAPIAAQVGRRARIVPNFVDMPPEDAQSTGCPGPVAFVGRLSHEKGPDRFAALAAMLGDIPCAVYGDGPMRAEVEAAARGRLRFYGMVPTMKDHWRTIGLLCVTSRHEGLPLVVLEAMAHRIPVVGFNVGALAEVVIPGETGWLVPQGDLEALAAAVGEWHGLEKGVRDALSSRCRDLIRRKYSVEACLPQILALYDQVRIRA